jgi:hypothetical protein
MTICVAAIAGNGIIFAASDRMKTGGDIEFEPRRVDPPAVPTPWLSGSKIFSATPSVAAMTAGDSSLQVEILYEAWMTIQARVRAQPANWWKVRDAVDVYVACYDRAKSKRAVSALLTPLGLTLETFIQNQATISDEFTSQLARQLQTFDMPAVDTIIMGVDEEGSHLYTTSNSNVESSCRVRCHDTVGFAAIGAGSRHASSQFMLSRYHRWAPSSEGLFLTYLAKKRAEIAPGVGQDTDMFTIGPNLGFSNYIRPDVVADVDQIYRRFIASEKRINKNAFGNAEELEQRILAARSEREQTAPPPPPPPPLPDVDPPPA